MLAKQFVRGRSSKASASNPAIPMLMMKGEQFATAASDEAAELLGVVQQHTPVDVANTGTQLLMATRSLPTAFFIKVSDVHNKVVCAKSALSVEERNSKLALWQTRHAREIEDPSEKEGVKLVLVDTHLLDWKKVMT